MKRCALALVLTTAAFSGCTGDDAKTVKTKSAKGSSSSSSSDEPINPLGKTEANPLASGSKGEDSEPNTAAHLKSIFARMLKARKEGDLKTAAKLARGLFPDADKIESAFREGSDGVVAKMNTMYSRRPPDSDTKAWATLFRCRPTQTEVQVHGATTEEIAANAKDSIVWKEFPGGAVQAAKKVLKPNATFYEVELTEPGKSSGMKYHLFFHNGKQFVMLGKVWRAMR